MNQGRHITHIPNFNVHKTTEAAAYLLQLYGGNRPVKFMRVLKLLYLADRKALVEWEKPITHDLYFSMPHGQVLSRTYDLMKGESHSEVWDEYIEQISYYLIRLKKQVSLKKLSMAEVELLNQIFEEYGHYDEFALGRITKGPEYTDPKGSSIVTPLDRLLGVLGYNQDEIERILADLESDASIDAVLGE